MTVNLFIVIFLHVIRTCWDAFLMPYLFVHYRKYPELFMFVRLAFMENFHDASNRLPFYDNLVQDFELWNIGYSLNFLYGQFAFSGNSDCSLGLPLFYLSRKNYFFRIVVSHNFSWNMFLLFFLGKKWMMNRTNSHSSWLQNVIHEFCLLERLLL